jgi:hypothetical protein
MKTFKLYILLCALVCVACRSNDGEGNKKEQPTLDGDYLTLKLDEIGIVPNGNDKMTVSFVDVSDNRCPKPSCYLCYGSEAHVSLIANPKNSKINFNLYIVGCIDEVIGDPATFPWGEGIDTLGYKFQLFQLSPYPEGSSINKKDYTVKIKITKL